MTAQWMAGEDEGGQRRPDRWRRPERARGSFLDYAKSRKSALHDDEAVAGLCHLMLSTPYYQLT